MKKIKVLVMLVIIVMGFSLNSINVYSLLGLGCIPIPLPCISDLACGHGECTVMYLACETAAVSICLSCEAACDAMAIIDVTLACLPACYTAKTIETLACRVAALAIMEIMKSTGTFDKATCDEGDDCVQQSPKVNDPQFVGKCENQLSPESKKKVIRDYIGRENEILATITPNQEWGTAINEVSKEGTVFKFPTTDPGPLKFAEFIKNGYLSNEVYQAQDPELLRMENVRNAASIANKNEPGKYTLKEEILKAVIGPLITQSSTKDNQILDSDDGGDLITAKNTETDLVTEQGEEELNDLEENKEDVNVEIDVILRRNSLKEVFFVLCKDNRVPRDFGKPNCIVSVDDSGRQEQSMTELAIDNEVIIGSIHVVDTTHNNIFTVKGDKNLGVFLHDGGFFNIHDYGQTEISVGSDGAYIIDQYNNRIFVGGGTNIYYGVGSDNIDTYIGNNLIFHIDSKIAFDATNDRSGDVFGTISLPVPTGAVSASPSDSNLAISFNHYTSPDFKNAVDLGSTGSGYQIIAKGFGDIILLGKEKLFPLLSRNVLKGDSAIIFNKDVKVINSYAARDHTYLYNIKSDGISTKVRARGKIIQDSAGLKREFTSRQRDLVYR